MRNANIQCNPGTINNTFVGVNHCTLEVAFNNLLGTTQESRKQLPQM